MNLDDKSLQPLFRRNQMSTDTLVDVTSGLEAFNQIAGLVPLIGYQIQATITLSQSIVRIIRVSRQYLIFDALITPLKELKGGHRMAHDLCEKVHKLLDLLQSRDMDSLGKETRTVSDALEDVHRYVYVRLLTYGDYKLFFSLLTKIESYLIERTKKHPVQKLLTNSSHLSVLNDFEARLDSLLKLITVCFSFVILWIDVTLPLIGVDKFCGANASRSRKK